jgi:membrane protein DedA with SNARE-associated domain
MLKDVISFIAGLVGTLLMSFGFYLFNPAAGAICLGVFLTMFSYLLSKAPKAK